MKEKITIYIFITIVIAVLSFAIGTTVDIASTDPGMETVSDHEHTSDLVHGHDSMDHAMFVVTVDNPPTIELVLLEDAKAGWNLQIMTTQFMFTPENANKDDVLGEGHAHLYIDDVKITRLYDNWYYIPELTQGEHSIRVDLNTNTHKIYVVNGTSISDSVTLTVTK